MSRPIRIAPSILAADFGRLTEEIQAITRAGADSIHVDVMDGHFVPNLTIGPMVVEVIRAATTLPLDVHLMIQNAERYLDVYADAGADILCVHVEACTHLHRAVQTIKGLGRRACVSLNPATPLDGIRYVLDELSMVLIMSVNPGFGGQSFIWAVLPKIEALRQEVDRRGLDVDIEVDGGITLDNVARVAAAGGNVIVSGSGIFKAQDYALTIGVMRERAESARPI